MLSTGPDIKDKILRGQTISYSDTKECTLIPMSDSSDIELQLCRIVSYIYKHMT